MSKYFPFIASAYSAAMFVYFAFISNENISKFILINILVFSIWSAYCWIIIYYQENIIRHLTYTIETTIENLRKLTEEEEEA